METEEEDNSKKFSKKATKMILPSNEVTGKAYSEGSGTSIRSLPVAAHISSDVI